MTPAAYFRHRNSLAQHEADRFNGLRERAQDLREKSTSLLELEQELRASGRDLNNREVELNAREAALRRRETQITKREDAALDAHVIEVRKRHAEQPAAPGALALPPDRAVPTDRIALAERIVFMGKVRRGEASLVPPPPDSPPGTLVRNALIALGRLPPEAQQTVSKEPTPQEVMAAQIIAAGKRRRAEL